MYVRNPSFWLLFRWALLACRAIPWVRVSNVRLNLRIFVMELVNCAPRKQILITITMRILPVWCWKNWVEICYPPCFDAGCPAWWSHRRWTTPRPRTRRGRGREPAGRAACLAPPRASSPTDGRTPRSDWDELYEGFDSILLSRLGRFTGCSNLQNSSYNLILNNIT